MNEIALLIGGRPFTWGELAGLFALATLLLLVAVTGMLMRSRRERVLEAASEAERSREIDDKMAEVTRLQSEMTGRMQTIAEVFGSRQSDLTRALSERMEGLQHRLGQGLESTARHQADNLSKLNERLAVIDTAQKNLTDLTQEVVGLKDVLSNKQTRGAYGQGRMEAIIRDALPCGAYEFQPTLSNRTRPDCTLKLPGDPRCLVVDAKFPLEGFTALRAAKGEEARARAAQRVRGDLGVHIKDLSEKYLIAGETQDMALMFVPAESLYADLQEHFEDVVQRAQKARIMIVSPSLLTLAIQVLQGLVRDARIRDEARKIQTEVHNILADVVRLAGRVDKLDAHFRQAVDDVAQIRTSAEKITRRGQRIEALDFDEAPTASPDVLRMQPPALRAVE